MYATTGLSAAQVHRLADLVRRHHPELDITPRSRGWHEALPFQRRVYLTICYLRRCVTEAVLAEFFNTSQPTVSRIIQAFTPAVAAVTAPLVPVGCCASLLMSIAASPPMPTTDTQKGPTATAAGPFSTR